ncbi:MAG TPA: nitrilase-related carbon-nitrogen hydrolase, partial [Actinomycetota bacterium]|nr:nitrilase-related carbon-nitrogen hydrolase [Actinomycetota bacterium]
MVAIALGQLNVTVGDLDGNVERMASAARDATSHGADVVAFPELAITGYPPEDLVLRPEFIRDNLEALDHLARTTSDGCDVIVGFVDRSERGLHNAAAVLRDGEVLGRYHKCRLPNYGVFDERRYFTPGEAGAHLRIGDTPVGLSVCEDAWGPGAPWTAYTDVPVIVNINGSPYHRAKVRDRSVVLRDRVTETGAVLVYVNAVG